MPLAGKPITGGVCGTKIHDENDRQMKKGLQPSSHNPLNLWWRRRDLNPRPPPCEGDALPAELLPHKWKHRGKKFLGKKGRPVKPFSSPMPIALAAQFSLKFPTYHGVAPRDDGRHARRISIPARRGAVHGSGPDQRAGQPAGAAGLPGYLMLQAGSTPREKVSDRAWRRSKAVHRQPRRRNGAGSDSAAATGWSR